MNFVSRAMAIKMVAGHDRLRNYEIEDRLEREYDGLWCISELCPFNGVFCMFGHIGETLSGCAVSKMAPWEFE